MDWYEYIVSEPGVCGGRPVIKGTRIAVDLLLELRESVAEDEELLQCYPHLSMEAIQAAFAYADEQGMIAYEDWGTEECPYHGKDASPSPGLSRPA